MQGRLISIKEHWTVWTNNYYENLGFNSYKIIAIIGNSIEFSEIIKSGFFYWY